MGLAPKIEGPDELDYEGLPPRIEAAVAQGSAVLPPKIDGFVSAGLVPKIEAGDALFSVDLKI